MTSPFYEKPSAPAKGPVTKALTVQDLYQSVEFEENVSYIDYWRPLDKSLVDEYIESHQIYTGCSQECVTCQITHIDKYKGTYPDTPRQSYLRQKSDKNGSASHAWQIQCPFIPNDYTDSLAPELKASMTNEEVEVVKLVKDPVAFASRYFNWHARTHQELMLRCQSKKKVLRWGRRAGKSESIVIETIWHALTKNVQTVDPRTGEVGTSGLKILVIAPFESQVINFFEMINKFIDRSPECADARKLYRKSPHHHLEFKNGCTIKGFTTGSNEAASVRGQDAHILIMDECDYMSEGDYKTVMPIAQSHPNVLVRAASTPQGKRERFYQWATQNPQWKEFYFPSAIIDKTPFKRSGIRWKDMRAEMRPEHSKDSWLQEIMAIFIASASGVFQPAFVSNAMRDYSYSTLVEAKISDAPELAGWRYTVGVDWNSNAGTEIVVVGLGPQSEGFQVMQTVNVPKQEFTQFKGLTRITEVLQVWQPDYVYVDAGHGATNYEALRLWTQQQPNGSYAKRLEPNIKKYDFGGKVEIRDPVDKKIVKHPAKAYMVENAVRKFENGHITFSKDDTLLKKQLLNYIVKSVSESGKPIYGFENKQLGDHRLDALNLALVAWALEEGNMARFNRSPVTKVGVVGSQGHQMLSMANRSSDKPSSPSRPINGRAALREVLTSRKDAIHQRNDLLSNDSRGNWEPTHQDRPGFLDDTEYKYDAKRAEIQSRVGRVSRRRGSRSSRSNL